MYITEHALVLSHSGLKSIAALDSLGMRQLFCSIIKWSITLALAPIVVAVLKLAFGVSLAETDWIRFWTIVFGFGILGALLRLLSIFKKRKITFTEISVEIRGPTEHWKRPKEEVRSISLTNVPSAQAIIVSVVIDDIPITLVSRADIGNVHHTLERLGYHSEATS